MARLSTLLIALVALPPALVPATARAAPAAASPQAQAGAVVLHPVTLVNTGPMDFGYLAKTAARTAVLDAETGLLSTTGGVVSLGGNPRAATFTGAAGSAAVVIIRIPKAPIQLTRVGGTETMTLSNWTLQGQDKRTLARLEVFSFRVGGTLSVAANQADGLYEGTFEVTVQYP